MGISREATLPDGERVELVGPQIGARISHRSDNESKVGGPEAVE